MAKKKTLLPDEDEPALAAAATSPPPPPPPPVTTASMDMQDFIDTREWAVRVKLGMPFGSAQVKFLPRNVKNNRALAMPYIDARHVMDRLDETVGVAGWSDEYTPLPDG